MRRLTLLAVVALAVAVLLPASGLGDRGGTNRPFKQSASGTLTVTSASAQTARTSKPWDLVYISDSSGWGVASYYARRIRQDRGVKVRVHDEWESELPAAAILKSLKDPQDPWIPLIRNAEVIVVYGNPTGLGIKGAETPEHFVCVTKFVQSPAVSPKTWRPYVATLKAIYKRIFAIRKGRPVILRTANWYMPWLKSWEKAGLRDACTTYWKSISAAIARAAKAYRVPMANVYRAFNGPDYLEDPIEKGYIQADGEHPSNKGDAVIAQTLADLGYKQVKAPR